MVIGMIFLEIFVHRAAYFLVEYLSVLCGAHVKKISVMGCKSILNMRLNQFYR